MTQTKVIICPYCGETQRADAARCRACAGLFEPLSRQATQNEMGPWFIRDPKRAFHPGCSYETLAKLVARGQIDRYTVIRGPSTRQFWTVARHVPGVAHLLGYCHACDAEVPTDALGCPKCGAQFGAYLDRNNLGLPDVRPLPGEAPETGDSPRSAIMPDPRWTAARPTGVSSFATDEELFGARDAPRPTNGHGPRRHDERPHRAHVTNEQLMASPAVRSMQRRLARQTRTIQFLTVIVVAIAAAGFIFNVVTLAAVRRAEPAPGRATETPPARGASARPTEPEAMGPNAVEALSGGEAASAAMPLDEESIGDDLAGLSDLDVVPVPAAAPSPWALELARADELLAAGADEQRTIAQRIADYEQALAILRDFDRDAPVDERPDDLAERIASAERELERLRLEEFFPG